jgi:hypothetical protein
MKRRVLAEQTSTDAWADAKPLRAGYDKTLNELSACWRIDSRG